MERSSLMILAIDMGNTNIVIGGIDENKTSFVERITTNPSKTDIEYAVNIKDILEIYQIPWEKSRCRSLLGGSSAEWYASSGRGENY